MPELMRISFQFKDAPPLIIEPSDIAWMLEAEKHLESMNRAVQVAKRLALFQDVI